MQGFSQCEHMTSSLPYMLQMLQMKHWKTSFLFQDNAEHENSTQARSLRMWSTERRWVVVRGWSKFIRILQQWMLWQKIWHGQMWTLRWRCWHLKTLLSKTLGPVMKWRTSETGTNQWFLILYSGFITAAQSQSFLCNEVCFILYFQQISSCSEAIVYFTV